VLDHKRLQPEKDKKISAQRMGQPRAILPKLSRTSPSEWNATAISKRIFRTRLHSTPVCGSVPSIRTAINMMKIRKEKKKPTTSAMELVSTRIKLAVFTLLIPAVTAPHQPLLFHA
jgi:hypothetical protein